MKKLSLALSIGVVSLGFMSGCSSSQPTQTQTQKPQQQIQPTPKQNKFIEIHVGNSTNTEMINVDHIVLVTKDTLQRTLISVDNSNTPISTNDSYNEVISEIEGGGK